jgi:hypothetical protein
MLYLIFRPMDVTDVFSAFSTFRLHSTAKKLSHSHRRCSASTAAPSVWSHPSNGGKGMAIPVDEIYNTGIPNRPSVAIHLCVLYICIHMHFWINICIYTYTYTYIYILYICKWVYVKIGYPKDDTFSWPHEKQGETFSASLKSIFVIWPVQRDRSASWHTTHQGFVSGYIWWFPKIDPQVTIGWNTKML